MAWCIRQYFAGIHVPQNLDIESNLKALRLLVSEIDVLLCKWPPFCINGLQNGGYNGMMYEFEGSAPLSI